MSEPSVSFSYGDENDAYYGTFSESGFSIGGGEVTKPEAAADPAASTLRISPEMIAIGGAVALVVILFALSGSKR
jgi:hypothetical protein